MGERKASNKRLKRTPKFSIDVEENKLIHKTKKIPLIKKSVLAKPKNPRDSLRT